jgi:hypothetical protein
VGRMLVLACLPWLTWMVVGSLLLFAVLRIAGGRINLDRLLELHANQSGSAQSLSFVLALPVLVMIVLFIVQVSQLMIGTIVTHYAAYAAARAAAVWIPARLSVGEKANCISSYYPDPNAKDQVLPSLLGPTDGGMWFVVRPGSVKYDKITSAAVMACMSISPSRDVGVPLSNQGVVAAEIIGAAYSEFLPRSTNNAAIPGRIRHKLAYAMANTSVEMRFYHKNSEPPLATHYVKDDIGEFYPNEIGWQDLIEVTVRPLVGCWRGISSAMTKSLRRSAIRATSTRIRCPPRPPFAMKGRSC